jgi:hypothetical protein
MLGGMIFLTDSLASSIILSNPILTHNVVVYLIELRQSK